MTVVRHALSIDVEDWFQVLNMQHLIARDQWDAIQLRCEAATDRFLELLDRRQARATFFFLGWIAERLPALVCRVRDAGHEIASHGYDHKLLPELGDAAGFEEDLARTEEILVRVAGVQPELFRACTWSVTARTPWALDVLARRGYRIDSSIYPIRHPDYGVPGAPITPYRLRTLDGSELLEFPPLTMEWLGRRVPVGGGGYLRLFPTAVLARGLRQQERRGFPGCIYLHPWELDPEQPRQPLGGVRGFRHYVNLRKTMRKLDTLLGQFEFTTMTEALGDVPAAELPVIEASTFWPSTHTAP